MKAKGIWSGLVGPVLFVSVFMVEGWLRSNYSVSRLEVSALSLGPRGWVQILNFMLAGSLFLVFSASLASRFKTLNGLRSGTNLLFLLGTSLILSGLFVMDPPGTPRPLWTLHGWIHELLGALVFTVFPISCFVFWHILRKACLWKTFRQWSFVVGWLLVVLLICMKIGQLQTPESFFAGYFGLLQRLVLISYMGWLSILAWSFANRYPVKRIE